MEQRKKRNLLLLNLVIAAFLVSVGLLVVESSGAVESTITEKGNGLDLYNAVYQRVLAFYVKDAKPMDISKEAIKGIMTSLDPYSEFMEVGDFKQLQDNTKGKFGGLGIEISVINDYPRVMSYPIPGTPAENVLRAGDEIVEIEGKSTKGLDVNEVVSILRGKVGDPVNIKIRRGASEDLLSLKLIRAEIPLLNVPYSGMLEPGIGYIKLTRFNQDASKEMDAAIDKILRENPKGIILDLRSNPGGLLIAARDISNKFLARNALIVSTKDRQGRGEKLLAQYPAKVPTLPLVVLVNRGSASASEIVAGAIQDHDRGVLVGETTFGKGSVQTIYDDLADGYGLKLTTALYYTPSDRSIHKDRTLEQLYEEESEDPAVVAVPDTSTTPKQKYYTLNKKRVVYGGGGIAPDVAVSEKTVGNIIRQLLNQSTFLDFSADYAVRHNELTPAFVVDSALLQEFKTYLGKPGKFTYEIPGASYLESFRSVVAMEEYDKDVLTGIDDLKAKLASKRDADFNASAETIKRVLKREITAAKFGSSESTVASKEWDVQLARAIEILKRPAEYDSILSAGAGR